MNKLKYIIGLCILLTLCLAGCAQSMVKSGMGSMAMELEPGYKLEMITWKDDSLWYLVKPMTEDDVAETHIFRQSSPTGIFQGEVTIVEKKAEE